MKILDIIADDSLNEGGFLSKLGIGVVDKYLEKKAAERALAAIEKKYANDIVRQKAAKDVAERYAKLLADAEAAGTPRDKGGLLDLENLLKDAAKNPNHPTLRNNKYYEDVEFMKMVDDLAEARKTQMVRDIQNPPAPPKETKPKDSDKEAGKAKDEPKASPAAGASSAEVSATDTAVKRMEKEGSMVGDTVRTVKYWAMGTLGLVGLGEIERNYEEDIATIEAQFNSEEIGKDDAIYFPPIKQEGTPVSSVEQYAYYNDPTSGKKLPYVYETKLGRLRAWRSWRETNARITRFTRGAQFLVAWGVGAGTLWPLSKLKWLAELAKKLDVSKSAGPLKKGLSTTVQGLIATLNTGGAMWFAREMGSRDMNDALRAIIWNDFSSYYPSADKIWQTAGASTMGHTAAIAMIIYAGNKALEIAGLGVKPRTTTSEPPATTDVPAANPNEKDPSQRNTPIDQSDSTEKPVDKPVDKPVEKPVDTPKPRPEDRTPSGRGAKFSAAKEAGAAEVVIGDITYKTADFVDSGRYWTNPKTGDSFLKN